MPLSQQAVLKEVSLFPEYEAGNDFNLSKDLVYLSCNQTVNYFKLLVLSFVSFTLLLMSIKLVPWMLLMLHASEYVDPFCFVVELLI